MYTGSEIAELIEQLGFTHVVWIPDSCLGLWEKDLERSSAQLVRVCREGELWPLAVGLHLGGKRPLIMLQSTGLFESGDALRNALFDLGTPLFAIVGGRSYLKADSPDTAKRFLEPILDAWEIFHVVVASAEDKPKLREHCLACRDAKKPGVVIVAEGRM